MEARKPSTIALTVLAYALTTFGVQGASHFAINAAHYATIPIMRAEPLVPLGVTSMLIQGTIFALLFPTFTRGGATIWDGVRFSWVLGAFLASYIVLGEAGKYAIPSLASWIAVEGSVAFVQYTLFGILLGLVHRPRPRGGFRVNLHLGTLPLRPALTDIQPPMAGASEVQVGHPTFEEQLMPLLGAAYRLAANLGADRAEAEDVVQEASLLAFRAFDSFEPGTNFRAWFFRIVTNCCYARHRQRGRPPQTVAFDDVPDLYLFTMTQEAGLYADTADPAAAVLGKIGVDKIIMAIDALPEEYRTAAALYFVEELTYEEIAETLDCPVGTVRSRLHRGRKLLQKALWAMVEETRN